MAQQTLNSIGLIDFISVTGSTVSMSSLGLAVGILFSVFVTLRATSLPRFSRGSMPTRPNRILSILSRRTPIEVGQDIVGRIVVLMASPQSLWPWTFENSKHKRMNHDRLSLALTEQRDGIVSTARLATPDQALRKHLPFEVLRKPASANDFAIYGSNSSMVRDFVTGIVRNCSPLFVSHDATVTLSMQMSGDNT